jgi:hypothetical protein
VQQQAVYTSLTIFISGTKYVVGTQQGMLSVFNRASGWGDCVDRIPGHPHSIDALCALPSSYPSAHSTILTGSSDGLLRAVQLYPTKLLGSIADHGEFPIEKVRVDMGGEGRWVGSVGHEELIKLTDLKEVFEDDEEGGEGDGDKGDEDDDSDEDDQEDEMKGVQKLALGPQHGMDEGQDSDEPAPPKDEEADASSDEEHMSKDKKRKRKEKDPLKSTKRKKGKDQMDGDKGFFTGL